MDDNRLAEQMPQTIGRYQILESIGFGAMGAVYKAFDPLIKRTLAIKTIRLDIPRNSPQYKSFIERFYHEARISGTLSHPNIVTLFDIGEEGGLPYLAMEYVEGETIASLVEKGTRFKPEKVIGLVSQIASAVDYAHSKGVIHRDIKPSNLILYEADRVKVTDFGIAKLVDAEMTQSGTLLGTPSYMSPEQAMGDKLDGRSDIFSLGVCAFEMLSGEQPFPGNNVTSILYKLVHVDPIEPANLEMHGLVPQKWHDVFGKVLAKKPDDRYQTATDFVQDLEYCLGAWFGSAMGEDTLDERAAGRGLSDVAAAAVASKPPVPPPHAAAEPAGDEVTKAMPVPPPPVRTPTPVPPVGALAPGAKTPVPPPPPAEEMPATVLMKPAATPPPPRAERGPDRPTEPLPRPEGGTPEDASTVVMKAPADESTVLMGKPPAPPGPTDTRPPVPAPPAPGGEKTVLMGAVAASAPAPAPAPRAKAKSEPRPPRPQAAVPAPVKPPVPPPAKPPAAARPAAPAKKGARLGIVIAGVVILLLAAMVGGGLMLLRSLRGGGQAAASPVIQTTPMPALTPITPPPPVVTAGTIHVESQPTGATVTVDGQTVGATPIDVAELTLGTHEVKVELRGYAPTTQTVELAAANPRVDLSIPLTRTAPETGSAEVLSVPPGATVLIDGTPSGQTPFTSPRLRAGTHRVELNKEGYEPWSGSLTVQAGKRARLDATLRAVAPVATPAPVAVDPNRIYVNSPAEVDTVARKTSGGSASYPGRAPRLRSGDAVSVRVSFVITETGQVTDLKVIESAGNAAVDEAVVSAMRSWKYTPAVKGGQKVKVRAEFRQTFRAG